jgi:hypothetical protein
MNINLMPFAVLWAVLALVVITLIVIRKRIASGEDDTIHVMEGDAAQIPHQREIAQKLEVVDRWGKSLTIAAVAFGLILGLLWVYQGWVNSSSLSSVK